MIRRLALVLLLALPALAQVSETIEVSITNIDVVVTDGKGNRIRGLKKEDFEVLQDGQPRQITNFTEYSVISSTAATPDAAEGAVTMAVAPPPPRWLMIVFDANSLTPTHRRGATAAAIAFVEKHVRPNDKVSVGVLSQNFTPRLPWTSDHAELRRVIGQIGGETATNRVQDDRKRAEDRIEALIDLAASSVGSSQPPPTFQDLMDVAVSYAEESLQRTRATTALLSNLVTQLAPIQEKKALIFIGEGLDARPGWELFQMLETIKSGGRPSPGTELILRSANRGKSPLIEAGRFSASAVFSALANAAYRGGVPIYAINPGTNEDIDQAMERHGSPPDRSQEFARFASKFIGYDLVATYSGGAAYSGQRADLALGAIAADLGGYYSIGFRASGPPKDAGSIRVRTKRGHHIRASLATAAPVSIADAVTEAVTAHHVVEPQTNDLDIIVYADEPVPAGDKQKVKLHILIPIANLALARQGNEITGGFDVYLSISDGKTYFSPVSKQTHAIRWQEGELEDRERTMDYTIEVTLEPGASLISVGVIDQRSKRTGYERIGIG